MERLIGNTIERVITDAGYRGHNAPRPFQVYAAGQQRDVDLPPSDWSYDDTRWTTSMGADHSN